MRDKIVLIVYLIILSIAIFASCNGCASNYQILKDGKGNQIKCTSSGYGIIGSTIANKHFNDCIENAKQKGYK